MKGFEKGEMSVSVEFSGLGLGWGTGCPAGSCHWPFPGIHLPRPWGDILMDHTLPVSALGISEASRALRPSEFSLILLINPQRQPHVGAGRPFPGLQSLLISF